MQVPDNKDVANHVVPESCASDREVRREALTGVRIGQPLSRDRSLSRVPTLFLERKAIRRRARHRVCVPTRRGQRTWHVRTLLGREPGDLQSDPKRPRPHGVRIGKALSRSR